jgi:hypothetical protein
MQSLVQSNSSIAAKELIPNHPYIKMCSVFKVNEKGNNIAELEVW